MTSRCRLAAFQLAIVAMLLRALLPVGWMPDPTGAAGFAICTMDGVSHQAVPSGKPTPDDGRHGHEECPFAAAPHVAPPLMVARLPGPVFAGPATDIVDITAPSRSVVAYAPHSPRAPPHSA